MRLFCAWSKIQAQLKQLRPVETGECAVLCPKQDLDARNCNRSGADMEMRVLYTKRGLSSETEIAAGAVLENVVWCPKRDLNPHSCNSQRILSPSCLPIPPSGQKLLYLKRGNQ